MVIVPSLSGDEKWPQGAVGDLQTGLDPVLRATPDGVFVLDGKDSVETALVEGVDDGSPVDLAEAGDAVTPPPDVPGVLADMWRDTAKCVAGWPGTRADYLRR